MIELSDSTPGHRDNFLKLVAEGFYTDLLFHRVINGFMIQGGDPESEKCRTWNSDSGSGRSWAEEKLMLKSECRIHLHFKGALAAALRRQATWQTPLECLSGRQIPQ